MTDNQDAPFGDVPLKIAMIGWTPKSRFGIAPQIGIPGRIIIIPQKDDHIDWFRHFGVTDSTGACWCEWGEMTKQQQLLRLYIEAWHIAHRDGVALADIHRAFSVIPEYRETIAHDFRIQTTV